MTSLLQRTTPLDYDPLLVRSKVVGPDSVSLPFPIRMKGRIEMGYGRGGKELNCPTANLPDSALEPYLATLTTGIYFGFASIHTAGTTPPTVYPMVMSLGWNPFYDNNRVVGEVHVLSKFTHDFYGEEMRVIILGFVRPEYNYTSLDALIKDIELDKSVSLASVSRPAYEAFRADPYFFDPSTLPPADPSVLVPRSDPRKQNTDREEVKL